MEKINCIICNSYNDHSIIEFNKIVFQHTFKLTKCKKCDLIYLNPRVDEHNIKDYYKESFINYLMYKNACGRVKILEKIWN